MTEERQGLDLESDSRDTLEDCNCVCLHYKQSKQCDNSPQCEMFTGDLNICLSRHYKQAQVQLICLNIK